MQGHDLPVAAFITFGEAWHGTHHAWPESARLGIEPGQHDPGWWVLLALRRVGLVWDLREPAGMTPRAGLRRDGMLVGADGGLAQPAGMAASRSLLVTSV